MQKIVCRFSCASLKGKILAAFIITSVLPTFVLLFFSYVNTSHIVRDHAKELMRANLVQIKSSLDVWTDSYEDILFQIYTNDDIVDLVEDINQENDTAAAAGKPRSILRGMFYTKEHIKCITVITDSGHVVFYDLPTGSVTKTSWMADTEYASCLGGENYAVIKGRNTEGALNFLEYATDEEQVKYLMGAFGYISADQSIAESQFEEGSVYEKFVEELQYAKARGPLADWPSVSDAISLAFNQVMTGAVLPEDAAAEAQTTIDGIVK